MTSPSRRKPPTTPPSTPRWSTASGPRIALGLAVLLIAGTARADDRPGFLGRLLRPTPSSQRARPNQPATEAPPRNRTRRPFTLFGRHTPPVPPPTPDEKADSDSVVDAVAPSNTGSADIRPARFDDADSSTDPPIDLPIEPTTEPEAESDPPRAAPNPLRTPSDEERYALRSIRDIRPDTDYEPDGSLADPCQNLCPRPDGTCPDLGMAKACPKPLNLPKVRGEDGRELESADLRMPGTFVYTWTASNLYSHPLYFDDPGLERYGHTYHPLVQPFASAGRMGTQLLFLPYKATIDPYWKRMYALGFYRPGDCAPRQIEPIPWNPHAAAVQGAAVTGGIFLIP